MSDTSLDHSAITKIGTVDLTGRVVGGYVRNAEPSRIVLRLLYPGEPTDIGVIDQIGPTGGQVTVHPPYHREWTENDRHALAGFFVARYHERLRTVPVATGEEQRHA